MLRIRVIRIRNLDLVSNPVVCNWDNFGLEDGPRFTIFLRGQFFTRPLISLEFWTK